MRFPRFDHDHVYIKTADGMKLQIREDGWKWARVWFKIIHP
jgi:hypothetical protein